jgi:hypothetical protein
VTFVFWDTWLTWPIQLLVVFVHECGHALAAVLTGGEVRSLEVRSNLSGQARTVGGIPFVILQAGYLASALFGAVLMVAATRPRSARNTLMVLAVLLAGCGVAFSSGAFGSTLLFAMLIATLFAWAARAAPEYVVRWGLVYIASVSALYSLLDIRQDLLHWSVSGASDATILAERTGIPALVWGLAWAAIAIAMMAVALRKILR